MNVTNNINSLQGNTILNDISKNNKTSETNFKDTVSSIEKTQAIVDRIEKEIPGVYLHAVDYKKIHGFQSYSYPIDKIFQKNLTLKEFNSFPRIKNTAMDSPEMQASSKSCFMKKAVLIHPDTLDKMSKDSAYADKIIAQIKSFTNKVGTAPMPYPDSLITSVTVSVDESGNVQRQWSTSTGIGISESKSGDPNYKARRYKAKQRLEEYIEKLQYERKLTQKAIEKIQISRRENIERIQKENLLKSNPYDLG